MSKQQTLDDKFIKETKVRCEICGKEFETIAHGHLKTHGITTHEYREQYPDALLMSDGYRKKISETLTGKEPTQKMIDGHKKRLGRHLTDEHKQHLRDSSPHLSREKNHMFGKHQSEEAKQKMRDNSPHISCEDHPMYGKGYLIAGENNGMFGKHQSKEAKQLISKGNLGKPKTELHKQHMRDNQPDRSGENNPAYKGGISFLPYCEKFDDDLKERVREFFDRKCYVCGKNEAENGQKLSVHHVNYNKMVCCNDVKPLFVPLCRSCHGKTQKDREYWEEFFIVSLEYLTDGKCFLPKKT